MTHSALKAPFGAGGPSELDAAHGRRLPEIALSPGGDDADLYFASRAGPG